MPEIKEGAYKVQRTAKDLAPVGDPAVDEFSSRLRNSISVKTYPKQQSAIVFTTVEYAVYVEFGHRGFWLYPRNKKVLRWVDKNGVEHFAKKVYIPPMPPRSFMNAALNRERAGMLSSMKKYIREQLKEKINE